MSSLMTFFYELLYMDTPVWVDKQKCYVHHLCADTSCSQEDLQKSALGGHRMLSEWPARIDGP